MGGRNGAKASHGPVSPMKGRRGSTWCLELLGEAAKGKVPGHLISQDVGQYMPHRLGPSRPTLPAHLALMALGGDLDQHRQIEHLHRVPVYIFTVVLHGRRAGRQRLGDPLDRPAPGRTPQDQQLVVVV